LKQDYKIPYGKEELIFSIPDVSKVTIASNILKSSINNILAETKKSLKNPINSKKLSEIVNEESSVCIVLTDITRPCPDKEILPPLIDEIEKKVARSNITLLIASGMHREMSYKEKVEKYGEKIVSNYRLIDHNATDENQLVSLGKTKNGTPIKISKIVYESDILISIGIVEPHQYAGYSGGHKTVAIGAAGDETISHIHSHNFLKHPKTKVGNLDGNIFQEDIIEIGKKVGLNFIVNVILDDNKKPYEIKAGEPTETHRTLVKAAKSIVEFPIRNHFDVAICGVGFPKDTNLYQACRAASYLCYLPNQIVKNNGYIIIPAKCQEGAGTGIGEKRFFTMLKNMTIDEILDYSGEFKAGEQRAFIMANVLKQYRVIIVGSETPDIVRKTKMIPAENMEKALETVFADLGNALKIIMIPNSLSTLPMMESQNQ